MEKVQKTSALQRFKKYTFRVLLGLILFLLVSAIVLSLPFVQSRIGNYVTEMLNKDFGSDISVEQVNISVFGGVKLKTVLIKDHHKDTIRSKALHHHQGGGHFEEGRQDQDQEQG